MADYTLPDLPYDYSALEPNISGRIMELHHDKHHKTYVDGANTAIAKLAEARDADDLTYVNKLEKDLAFNLAGHVNHTVFWNNLSPDGGDKPVGELAAAVRRQVGPEDRVVDVAAEVEREVLLELVDVGEVARVARLGELREGRVGTGHVRLVVLRVVQLHDPTADRRLEGRVVVREIGEGVVSHCFSLSDAGRAGLLPGVPRPHPRVYARPVGGRPGLTDCDGA